MPTRVEFADRFDCAIRKLKKKYPSVDAEVETLVTQLENDERPGDKIPNVGYDVYKVRLRNPSASTGKSGGFRVIYYLRLEDHVILLTIYSKSDQSDLNPEAIKEILESIDHADEDED
ncbi:type II toxin-antitoxin system RelE/ParE family toxin [bacterium]|nr:type II toxin-antitoxin system RelE/ParE family toxin [bacterium]